MTAKRLKVQEHLHRTDPDTGRELFLVLRRPADRGGIWQSITGNVDPGEDLAVCAVREVWEETGIQQVDDCRAVHEYDFVKDGRVFHETVYVARVSGTEVRLSGEHTEARWLPYDEARALIHYDGIKSGLDHAWKSLPSEQK